MTGPEHYAEAERIMTEQTVTWGGREQNLGFPEAMTMAQLHATLALAAATAVNSPADKQSWAAAAGIPIDTPS